jgi:hypothetical protein
MPYIEIFQLQELGRRACSSFQSTYDKVKQFFVMKHHQQKLSAARYLTFDPDGERDK